MRRTLVILSVLAANAISVSALAGPGARDPYLWLEDVNSERARSWVRTQNETTLGQLRTDPAYKQARAAAEQIVKFKDVIPRDQVLGNFVYSFRQTAENPFGTWLRSDAPSYLKSSPNWQVLFDLDAANKLQGSSLNWRNAKCLPPDLSKCLMFLATPSGRGVVVREYDVASKSFVSGGFEVGEAETEVEWIDPDTVLIATNWGKRSLTQGGKPRIIKIWSRGQNLRDAVVAYQGETIDIGVAPRTIFSDDGRVSIFAVRQQSANAMQIFHIDESGKPMRLTVPASAQFKGLLQRQAIFYLNSDWRIAGQNHLAGSIISFSLDQYLKSGGAIPQVHQVYVANQKSSVTGIAISSEAVFVSLLENVQGRMNELTFDGRQWLWRRITLPNHGAVDIVSASEFGPDVLLKYSSFLTPDSLQSVRKGLEPKLLKQLSARFDSTGAEVTQLEAVSSDGTRIPYFLVKSRGLSGSGATPTLLYAYGGFQISTTPWYWSSAGKLWLEQGGAYVIANIRGGGEFGREWHAAATGENRQRNFDDLAAVARDMIARGITTPQQLGIFGSSQGGLLVAGTFVQNPELFSAVVAQVPLTDMLRYTKLAASRNWVAEYGDPSDPAMREIIAQWSPYQNVRPGVKYPNVFFMTSTQDSRVHPGHARKMAAKMEDMGSPVLYYEDQQSTDADQRAEQLALAFTYFRKVLMN